MNQWLGSGAARAYGDGARQSPPDLAEPSGYISGRFAIGTQGLMTEATTESCSYPARQVRSTRSVSQGTEVTIVTEYVPYRYSSLYCVLLKMLWEHSSITPC